MNHPDSNSLARVLEAVCAALLGLLAVIATVELFSWLFWHRSYAAIEEIQGVLVVWLGLLAAAYCLIEGLHLAVELVARALPAAWQATISRVPGIASAAFGALLAVYGARLVLAIENTLPGTGWSASVHYQPAVVAGALIAWIGLTQAISPPSSRPKQDLPTSPGAPGSTGPGPTGGRS